MFLLVAVLVIMVIVFGVSSGMQSYAVAEQAKATAEVAQVAQVNAWGNLVTILTLALVIVGILALIIWVFWMFSKRGTHVQPRALSSRRTPQLQDSAPQLSLNELIQLQILKTLQSMNQPSLPAGEEQVDEPLAWLRKQ